MKITDIIKIIKNMGLSWTVFRVSYELKRKTGILKRKFSVKDFTDEDFLDRISENRLKSKESLSNYIKENRHKFLFLITLDISCRGKLLKSSWFTAKTIKSLFFEAVTISFAWYLCPFI